MPGDSFVDLLEEGQRKFRIAYVLALGGCKLYMGGEGYLGSGTAHKAETLLTRQRG